jgi:hypothetical protein
MAEAHLLSMVICSVLSTWTEQQKEEWTFRRGAISSSYLEFALAHRFIPLYLTPDDSYLRRVIRQSRSDSLVRSQIYRRLIVLGKRYIFLGSLFNRIPGSVYIICHHSAIECSFQRKIGKIDACS